MAHVLKITDGTNTVTLSSGNMFVSDYIPQVSLSGEFIQESALIGFTGGLSTIRSNVQSLNRLFVQARNYTRNRTGARVYVEFDPNTSGTVYRSLLYSGGVEMTPDVLGNQWGSGTLELNVAWTRDPFWEGPLTQIPLSTFASTSSTDYVVVTNRNDASGGNWASIAAANVIGDRPAPIELEMVNTTTDANATDEIFLWHNAYSTPLSLDYTIEGESSTDATSTTDANSSSAAYGIFSWSTTDETKIGEWALSSSDLTSAAGGRFAIVARWPAVFPYTNCWLRFTLETAVNYSMLWEGNLSLVAATTDADHQRQLHMLDTLRLPPYLEGQTSIKSIVLRLYGLRNSTDNDVSIDYLQFSPISADSGWKRFKSVDRGIATGETFIHDNTEGFTYRQDGSSLKIGEFTDYGGPILLVPNCDQRIIFNTCDYLGVSGITQGWNVKLWYRPRRDSL